MGTLVKTKQNSGASHFRAMYSGHLAGTSMASWALGTQRAETPSQRWFSRPKPKAKRSRCSGVETGALQSSQNKIKQSPNQIFFVPTISHFLYRAFNVFHAFLSARLTSNSECSFDVLKPFHKKILWSLNKRLKITKVQYCQCKIVWAVRAM